MATASVVKIGPELGNEILEGPDATRFLVVRHPLLRFYSGFRQKFKTRIFDPTFAAPCENFHSRSELCLFKVFQRDFEVKFCSFENPVWKRVSFLIRQKRFTKTAGQI